MTGIPKALTGTYDGRRFVLIQHSGVEGYLLELENGDVKCVLDYDPCINQHKTLGKGNVTRKLGNGGRSMNLENFNSELSKRLDGLKTEKRNRGAAIIGQLINDIQENDWYCIQNGSECNLHEWEKALLVAGLKSLSGSEE